VRLTNLSQNAAIDFLVHPRETSSVPPRKNETSLLPDRNYFVGEKTGRKNVSPHCIKIMCNDLTALFMI